MNGRSIYSPNVANTGTRCIPREGRTEWVDPLLRHNNILLLEQTDVIPNMCIIFQQFIRCATHTS